MKFAIVLLVLMAIAMSSALPFHPHDKCQLLDAAGTGINVEFFKDHPVHVTGLLQPGQIYMLNTTWMHNHEPGQTTFEDDYSSVAYQFNAFLVEGAQDCAFRFIQAYKRLTGHWVIADWLSSLMLGQWASQEQLGDGPSAMFHGYQVQCLVPRIFDQAGLGALKMSSRHMSFSTELTVFNFPVEVPGLGLIESGVIDEFLAPLPGRPGESYYSISLYQGVHNGFADWAFIHRTTHVCAT